MKTRALLLLTAFLMPMTTSAAESATLELKKVEAERVLADQSFGEGWLKPDAMSTREAAERAKEESRARRKALDRAFDDMCAWCNTRFFVNACVEDARKVKHQREREIRAVTLKADELIRADHTRRQAAKQAERERDARAPMSLGDGVRSAEFGPQSHIGQSVVDVEENRTRAEARRQLEEANERAYEKKQREAARRAAEHHDPVRMKRRSAAEESAPLGLHLGHTQSEVDAKQAEAEERRKQEDANEAAYEAKQAAARERMAEAEAMAAKRRAEREAREARLNKTLKERREAQARYEEKKGERKSGLERYF